LPHHSFATGVTADDVARGYFEFHIKINQEIRLHFMEISSSTRNWGRGIVGFNDPPNRIFQNVFSGIQDPASTLQISWFGDLKVRASDLVYQFWDTELAVTDIINMAYNYDEEKK